MHLDPFHKQRVKYINGGHFETLLRVLGFWVGPFDQFSRALLARSGQVPRNGISQHLFTYCHCKRPFKREISAGE